MKSPGLNIPALANDQDPLRPSVTTTRKKHSRKCQAPTATPAEPGGLPLTLERSPIRLHRIHKP
jgi:hypothetical protein